MQWIAVVFNKNELIELNCMPDWQRILMTILFDLLIDFIRQTLFVWMKKYRDNNNIINCDLNVSWMSLAEILSLCWTWTGLHGDRTCVCDRFATVICLEQTTIWGDTLWVNPASSIRNIIIQYSHNPILQKHGSCDELNAVIMFCPSLIRLHQHLIIPIKHSLPFAPS